MSGNGHARPLVESIRTLEHDTQALFVAIEQLSESVNEALRDQMDRRPYAALGGAFVAGYVLGGGLSSVSRRSWRPRSDAWRSRTSSDIWCRARPRIDPSSGASYDPRRR